MTSLYDRYNIPQIEQSGDIRVLGVDLLRTLSMSFVVVLHALGTG